jgi:hypothetical protein
MNQTEKATRFAELHVKGTPLLLYNVWDAGSARSVVPTTDRTAANKSGPSRIENHQ